MVAKALSIVPKRYRVASAAGAAWLASELLTIGGLAAFGGPMLQLIGG